VTIGDRVAGAAVGVFFGVPTGLLVWLLANLLCAYSDVPGPIAFSWLGIIAGSVVAVGFIWPASLPGLLGWVWDKLVQWLRWI
jgi:hypothetical protein